MPVTTRTLRRLRANPAAIKVGAGALAGAIGMTTAAYGILHIVVPFKGNGARSDVREAESTNPGNDLLASVLSLIPADDPLGGGLIDDSGVLFDIGGSSELVLSVIDSATGSTNGIVGGGSGGTGGGSGGTGDGGGGLLGDWEGPTFSPPSGGGGEGRALDLPGVNVTPPPVPLGDLAMSEDDPCAAEDEALADGVEKAVDTPFVPETTADEAEETEPACEEPPAEQPPAEGEEAPADSEEAPAATDGGGNGGNGNTKK